MAAISTRRIHRSGVEEANGEKTTGRKANGKANRQIESDDMGKPRAGIRKAR